MRRPELWENVKTVVRYPRFESKERRVFEGPLVHDKRPGPVRIYTREELIQWPAL